MVMTGLIRIQPVSEFPVQDVTYTCISPEELRLVPGSRKSVQFSRFSHWHESSDDLHGFWARCFRISSLIYRECGLLLRVCVNEMRTYQALSLDILDQVGMNTDISSRFPGQASKHTPAECR